MFFRQRIVSRMTASTADLSAPILPPNLADHAWPGHLLDSLYQESLAAHVLATEAMRRRAPTDGDRGSVAECEALLVARQSAMRFALFVELFLTVRVYTIRTVICAGAYRSLRRRQADMLADPSPLKAASRDFVAALSSYMASPSDRGDKMVRRHWRRLLAAADLAPSEDEALPLWAACASVPDPAVEKVSP